LFIPAADVVSRYLQPRLLRVRVTVLPDPAAGLDVAPARLRNRLLDQILDTEGRYRAQALHYLKVAHVDGVQPNVFVGRISRHAVPLDSKAPATDGVERVLWDLDVDTARMTDAAYFAPAATALSGRTFGSTATGSASASRPSSSVSSDEALFAVAGSFDDARFTGSAGSTTAPVTGSGGTASTAPLIAPFDFLYRFMSPVLGFAGWDARVLSPPQLLMVMFALACGMYWLPGLIQRVWTLRPGGMPLSSALAPAAVPAGRRFVGPRGNVFDGNAFYDPNIADVHRQH